MISFSGIDCSGKSTQIELITKEYEKRGIRYQVIWSRGGYTPGISLFKKIIKGNKKVDKVESLKYSENIHESLRKRKILFIASMIDLCFYYSIVFRIKELFGKNVICDRYIWDTYIDFKIKYPESNFENGFWWRLILKVMLKPQKSFILLLPAKESMYRSTLKEEPFPEPINIRETRISMYIEEVSKERWQHQIDATKSIAEVFSAINSKFSDTK